MNNRDYHEYVFKNGRLVGKFEEMYKFAKNIPWHQNEIFNFPDITISKTILNLKSPFNSVVEIGCGLGYYLNSIESICRNKEKITGIDISKTAIEKARKKFSHLRFICSDITNESFTDELQIIRGGELVVIRGLFWYVFDQIEMVVKNISSTVEDGGYLFIQQNFPPLDENFIGKEIIPNPEALIEYFTPNFTLLIRNDFNLCNKRTNDYWLSILMRKNQ